MYAIRSYYGQNTYANRVGRVEDRLAARGLDALVVNFPDNINRNNFV